MSFASPSSYSSVQDRSVARDVDLPSPELVAGLFAELCLAEGERRRLPSGVWCIIRRLGEGAGVRVTQGDLLGTGNAGRAELVSGISIAHPKV